ncbi:hypothetical protein GQ457_04G020730 [Hibiscus cannabinus]
MEEKVHVITSSSSLHQEHRGIPTEHQPSQVYQEWRRKNIMVMSSMFKSKTPEKDEHFSLRNNRHRIEDPSWFSTTHDFETMLQGFETFEFFKPPTATCHTDTHTPSTGTPYTRSVQKLHVFYPQRLQNIPNTHQRLDTQLGP